MKEVFDIILKALPQTLIMVFASTFLSVIIGLLLGIVLQFTADRGLRPNPGVYKFLDAIINILRSIPFVILMIVVFPLSRLIVGKSYGTAAMIIPLSICAAPFVARLVEGYLDQVDRGIVEAAQSMGSTDSQIIFKVLLPEALPMLINGLAITIINIVAYSAMAGVMGGGGLGDVANRYGYQRKEPLILWAAVIVIIILVQSVQAIGNGLSKKIDRK